MLTPSGLRIEMRPREVEVVRVLSEEEIKASAEMQARREERRRDPTLQRALFLAAIAEYDSSRARAMLAFRRWRDGYLGSALELHELALRLHASFEPFTCDDRRNYRRINLDEVCFPPPPFLPSAAAAACSCTIEQSSAPSSRTAKRRSLITHRKTMCARAGGGRHSARLVRQRRG